MQFAMQTVVEGRTSRDPVAGFALLREDPWYRSTHLRSGVQGYAAALRTGTNWRQLRADLDELISEKWAEAGSVADPEGTGQRAERDLIDLIIGREWAQRDLNAALEWYVGELPHEKSKIEERTLNVLNAVPAGDRHRVVEWLEGNADAGAVNDRIVSRFASSLSRQSPDALVERMIRIPQAEEHRATIITAFTRPMKKDDELVLRHPPETLRRLIDIAQLSASERARFLSVVENTPYK